AEPDIRLVEQEGSLADAGGAPGQGDPSARYGDATVEEDPVDRGQRDLRARGSEDLRAGSHWELAREVDGGARIEGTTGHGGEAERARTLQLGSEHLPRRELSQLHAAGDVAELGRQDQRLHPGRDDRLGEDRHAPLTGDGEAREPALVEELGPEE